jgi:hypothetical protein
MRTSWDSSPGHVAIMLALRATARLHARSSLQDATYALSPVDVMGYSE